MAIEITRGQTVEFGDASTLTIASVTEMESGSVSVAGTVCPKHSPGTEREVSFIVGKRLLDDPSATVESAVISAAAQAPTGLAWAFNFGGDTLALEAARRACLRLPDASTQASAALASAEYTNDRLTHLESDIVKVVDHATRNL